MVQLLPQTIIDLQNLCMFPWTKFTRPTQSICSYIMLSACHIMVCAQLLHVVQQPAAWLVGSSGCSNWKLAGQRQVLRGLTVYCAKQAPCLTGLSVLLAVCLYISMLPLWTAASNLKRHRLDAVCCQLRLKTSPLPVAFALQQSPLGVARDAVP